MSGKTRDMKSLRSPVKTTGLEVRGRDWRKVTIGLALTLLLLLNRTACAGDGKLWQSICSADRCGLLVDGAYPHLVIGRLASVGTPADMNQVFHWAKTHGYWKSLPASITPYLRDVQMVMIDVPKGTTNQSLTLFMLRTEFTAAPYHVGDLVRYAPHDAAHDETATGSADDLALFHNLTGCVAVLCQKGDGTCLARYRQGAFRHTDGQQVSTISGLPVSPGTRIDPVSLLPLH
ncbi:MAG: hypothetical protein RSP_20940 [Rhodanobacter sp.]